MHRGMCGVHSWLALRPWCCAASGVVAVPGFEVDVWQTATLLPAGARSRRVVLCSGRMLACSTNRHEVG